MTNCKLVLLLFATLSSYVPPPFLFTLPPLFPFILVFVLLVICRRGIVRLYGRSLIGCRLLCAYWTSELRDDRPYSFLWQTSTLFLKELSRGTWKWPIRDGLSDVAPRHVCHIISATPYPQHICHTISATSVSSRHFRHILSASQANISNGKSFSLFISKVGMKRISIIHDSNR